MKSLNSKEQLSLFQLLMLCASFLVACEAKHEVLNQPDPRSFKPGATKHERFLAAKSVLDAHCTRCHSSEPRNFDFQNEKDFIRFGWVTPTKAETSKLFFRLRYAPGGNMPPANQEFSYDSFQILQAWINLMEEADQLQAEPFVISKKTVRMLPFPVLTNKLQAVLRNQAPEAVDKLLLSKFILGESDYANGVGSDQNWTPRKMDLWIRRVNAICDADSLKYLYPWPRKANDFFLRAMGRNPNQQEHNMITQISNDTKIADADKFTLFCTGVLSSAEFVSL